MTPEQYSALWDQKLVFVVLPVLIMMIWIMLQLNDNWRKA